MAKQFGIAQVLGCEGDTSMRYGAFLCVVLAVVAGCKGPFQQNLPPAQQLMEMGPGVGGPGPGVQAAYMPMLTPAQVPVSQIHFAGPEGMQVNWDVSAPGAFDSEPLVCPGRYNFPQGAIYRLKLTNIPGRPGVELYPTLEVAPAMPRTEAFIAHNAIPVQFTEEDFDQVLSGNFVTKVVYLPDPSYQELAVAGAETLVSTRLDPGVDPIIEADRRGSILCVIRMGNRDLQVPGDVATMSDVMPTGASPNGMSLQGTPFAPTPVMAGGGTVPMNYISGVTGPQYGMPISGTPIGLPGPPHVPLGGPAGLQKHVMRNHTFVHIPQPTEKVRIDVKQSPGISYPQPANHAWIHEQTMPGATIFRQPYSAYSQHIDGTSGSHGYPVYDPGDAPADTASAPAQ
jgi:hypothetical protein